MFVTLTTSMPFFEVSQGKHSTRIIYPPGRYEVERRPNPFGHRCPWIYHKGTDRGVAETSLRGKSIEQNPQVIFEEAARDATEAWYSNEGPGLPAELVAVRTRTGRL
jgi:hypothetical protein